NEGRGQAIEKDRRRPLCEADPQALESVDAVGVRDRPETGGEMALSQRARNPLMRSASCRGYCPIKAWPPLNCASQAPGIALASVSAFEEGITMSSVPAATNAGGA